MVDHEFKSQFTHMKFRASTESSQLSKKQCLTA